MTPAVLADTLNLTHQIKTYGAYAGFAAIIGLAVLSVLYFAQAREVKRLREWAGRGPERAAEVGARAVADPNKRIVAEPIARPEPATVAAQSSPPPSAAKPATLAAVGVAGAAGVAAATDGKDEKDEKDDGEKSDADAEVATDADPTPGGDASEGDATSIVKPDAPSEDTPPEASSGDTEDDIGQTSIAMAPIPASARARASASPTPARRPRNGTPPPEEPEDEHSPWRNRLVIGGGVLALVIIALVLINPFGSDSKKAAAPNKIITTTKTPTAVTSGGVKGGSASNAPPRNQIKVGVLNGTGVPGLAKSTGQKLSGAGFTVPPESETNASDQTHAATVIAYAPGQKSSALAVAKTLGLGRDSLAPLDADTRLVAGVPDLNVVVTVGADLNP